MNEKMIMFINECIKNRKFLEYTHKDMSNCLIGVSEKDYADFESGNYTMSKENLDRIVRVLKVKKPTYFDVSKYINVDEYDEEEIDDLTKVISTIVGEDND